MLRGLTPPLTSGCAEGFGRGEAGGAEGRVEAGDAADEECGEDAAGHRPHRDDGRPALRDGEDRGDHDADRHAADAAERGEQERFGQELATDVRLGGAQRTAQADLVCLLYTSDAADE